MRPVPLGGLVAQEGGYKKRDYSLPNSYENFEKDALNKVETAF